MSIEISTVVGLDLAGSPKRPTGFCLLRGWDAETSDLFSDAAILDAVRRAAPVLVAIDAPLNLPPGRTSIHERNDSHYRVCDLELRRRHIPSSPSPSGRCAPSPSVGIRLRRKIEKLNIRVIEMYPGGAQDVWGIPRARRDRAGLKRGLRRLGLKGLRKDASDHELDAATGALVGRDFLAGQAEVYGNFEEGAIVMPSGPAPLIPWNLRREGAIDGGMSVTAAERNGLSPDLDRDQPAGPGPQPAGLPPPPASWVPDHGRGQVQRLRPRALRPRPRPRRTRDRRRRRGFHRRGCHAETEGRAGNPSWSWDSPSPSRFEDAVRNDVAITISNIENLRALAPRRRRAPDQSISRWTRG